MLHCLDKSLARLKVLYGELEPTANEDRAPRAIAFYLSGKKADELSVSVAKSKDFRFQKGFYKNG